MLRFIVLGEIPGTHLVITFYWVLFMAVTLVLAGELFVIYRKRKPEFKHLFKLPHFTQRRAK